jgi:hypothetical protein
VRKPADVAEIARVLDANAAIDLRTAASHKECSILHVQCSAFIMEH